MYTINKYVARRREYTFIELKNDHISATFMDYGATIINILTPDHKGNMESIVMAYDQLSSYIKNEMYLNAIIGPISGRIKNATFKIDDNVYELDKNFFDEENLHSGKECLAFKFFDYEVEDESVLFTYYKKKRTSKFPGNQVFKIKYTLIESSILIEFMAETDEDTLTNLTTHTYFNLTGNLKDDILDHNLKINSSKTIDLDDNFVPYKVIENPNHLDFLDNKKISTNFDGIYELKELGIDNPLMFNQVSFDIPQVQIYDEISKRAMDIHTTYPTVVVYTHNHPDKKKLLYKEEHNKHMGICFETQFEPNGINIDGLNSSILRKGEKYYEKTLLKFYIKK